MIRRARLDERAALIELQRAASLMWAEDRAALLADPTMIDIPADQITEGHVFVWEAQGQVLGFVVVLPREDGAAELDGLFTAPDQWGQGIGRALVDHAMTVARDRGCISLNLVANHRALGFYEKCGFQILGVVDTGLNPGVGMVRIV